MKMSQKIYFINAINNGNIQEMIHLLENGADINLENSLLLSKAIQSNNYDSVKFLLDNGINTNSRNFLSEAIESIDILELLLENKINNDINQAFLRSCKNNFPDAVQILIKYGTNIHYNNDKPLIISCKKGFINIVEILLNNGADIRARKQYPVIAAIKSGYIDIVKLLFERGACVQINDYQCIFKAINLKYNDIAKYLLEVNSFKNRYWEKINKDLYKRLIPFCADHNNLEMMVWIIETYLSESNLTEIFKDDKIINMAAFNNNYDIVKYIIENHSNENSYLIIFERSICDGCSDVFMMLINLVPIYKHYYNLTKNEFMQLIDIAASNNCEKIFGILCNTYLFFNNDDELKEINDTYGRFFVKSCIDNTFDEFKIIISGYCSRSKICDSFLSDFLETKIFDNYYKLDLLEKIMDGYTVKNRMIDLLLEYLIYNFPKNVYYKFIKKYFSKIFYYRNAVNYIYDLDDYELFVNLLINNYIFTKHYKNIIPALFRDDRTPELYAIIDSFESGSKYFEYIFKRSVSKKNKNITAYILTIHSRYSNDLSIFIDDYPLRTMKELFKYFKGHYYYEIITKRFGIKNMQYKNNICDMFGKSIMKF